MVPRCGRLRQIAASSRGGDEDGQGIGRFRIRAAPVFIVVGDIIEVEIERIEIHAIERLPTVRDGVRVRVGDRGDVRVCLGDQQSTPIQVGPATADLSTFTPANSLGLLIRTADFTNSRPAQIYQWNLGLQYQLTKDTVVEAAYAATRGTRLTLRVNLNQIPWERALAGFTTQADRLFPNVGNQVVMDSAMGNNHYHALNLRAEKRLSSGLNFLVNYTWSKNLENGSGGNSAMAQNGGTTNPLDSWNLRKEKAVSAMDLPYVFVVSSGYELPFGKGKPFASENAIARAVLGGWQLNGIFVSQSGFPTDIRSTRVAATNQLFATFNVPDLVLGQSLYLPNGGPDGYFNPAAFAEPGTVTNAKGVALTKFGTLARRARIPEPKPRVMYIPE